MNQLDEQHITIGEGKAHYYEMGEQHPRSLILLHGALGDARLNWEPAIPLLADQYHMVAPDLPGYGQSDPLPRPSYDTLVNWLKQFIDGLGIMEATLIGASFGALIARLFAAQYPRQVRGLVLVSGGALPGDAGIFKTLARLPVIGGQLLLSQARAATTREQIQELVKNQSLITDEFVARLQANAGGLANTMRLLSVAPTPELKTLWTSPLLLWGQDDSIAPGEIARSLARILTAKLEFIADCRHLPQVEEPDVFAWQVKTYLDQLEEKRSAAK